MNTKIDSLVTKEQMLACPGIMPVPRNQWYVAALSSEVNRKIMKRQILDDHIVFFRTEDGTAVALSDRCPHRGVPLSMGTVDGNIIRCAYHGFEYGKTGACTHIPSQNTIAEQMAVRSYPLYEVGSYLWIWMGLPSERDDSLLPDMFELGLTRPGYKVTPLFVMEINCNFQLLHENLLDTSHITFLHPGMIDGGNMAKTSFTTSYKNGRVTISRDITETPTAMMARTFHLKHADTKPVRRRLITDAIPPHLSVITNIFTYPDEPDAPEHVLINPQGVTPSGKNRCFNFMVVSSSYQDEQPQDVIPHLQKLVAQDKVVLEAVQKRFDEEGWNLPEVSIRADAAAVNFRIKMAAMVEEERRRFTPKAAQSA
jgi:phenylpropionate dioxygenase-like ring-hydroxylating dioxygenase large terminal subunit